MPADLLKDFGDGRHPAAGRLISIDDLAVEQHFEYAVMALDQLRLYAESLVHCFRQTGGVFEKTSFHAVMDDYDFRSRLIYHNGLLGGLLRNVERKLNSPD